jgi:hypothetical protein
MLARSHPHTDPQPHDPFAPRQRPVAPKPGRPAHLPNPRSVPSSLPRPRPVRRGGMR